MAGMVARAGQRKARRERFSRKKLPRMEQKQGHRRQRRSPGYFATAGAMWYHVSLPTSRPDTCRWAFRYRVRFESTDKPSDIRYNPYRVAWVGVDSTSGVARGQEVGEARPCTSRAYDPWGRLGSPSFTQRVRDHRRGGHQPLAAHCHEAVCVTEHACTSP